jgi:hypothetical protein
MSGDFLASWHEAARTSLGLFWMAFWAFGLGYLISSMIQVFVTRERMQKSMGESGPQRRTGQSLRLYLQLLLFRSPSHDPLPVH